MNKSIVGAAYHCSMGMMILAKVFLANNISHSFAEDPLDIWMALGIANILIYIGVQEWKTR